VTVALWIVNALLALAFAGAGVMKLVRPRATLASSGLAWVEDFSPGAVKLIGLAELLGALGLVLPLATGIAPVLAPVAAVALAATMVGAVVVHVRRREPVTPAVALLVVSAASAVLGFLVVLG
jgi:hypothetical protein